MASETDTVRLDLTHNDISIVLRGLYREGGEMAASEARRTGGRGFASLGVMKGVEEIHDLYDRIRDARDSALENEKHDAS